MKVYDNNGNLMEQYDLNAGRLEPDRLFVRHHDAAEAVEEVGHYEVTAEYPNGGKDVAWVIDVPGAEACEAWDEYEDIMRYVPYTAEELEAMAAPPEPPDEITLLRAQVQALTERGEFLEDCLAEMAMAVYGDA